MTRRRQRHPAQQLALTLPAPQRDVLRLRQCPGCEQKRAERLQVIVCLQCSLASNGRNVIWLPRQQGLLAELLLARNHRQVSMEELLPKLWPLPDDEPQNAEKMISIYCWRLSYRIYEFGLVVVMLHGGRYELRRLCRYETTNPEPATRVLNQEPAR